MLNYERSLRLGEEVGARTAMCFWNSRDVLIALTDEERPVETPPIAYYVEGYAAVLRSENIIYHGWLETETGEIVDPTMWAYFEDLGDEESRYYSYHPAVRISVAEFWPLYERTSHLPLLETEDESRQRAAEEARASASEQEDIEPSIVLCNLLASMCLRNLYRQGNVDCCYVEGYITNTLAESILRGAALNYAWVEADAGEVIDPMLEVEEEDDNGTPRSYTYHAAYRFTLPEFESELTKNAGELPLRRRGEELVQAQHEAYKGLKAPGVKLRKLPAENQ
jgi:hypothetical protein